MKTERRATGSCDADGYAISLSLPNNDIKRNSDVNDPRAGECTGPIHRTVLGKSRSSRELVFPILIFKVDLTMVINQRFGRIFCMRCHGT